jgi:hypothetical protein
MLYVHKPYVSRLAELPGAGHHDGHEFDAWSGSVLLVLKRTEPCVFLDYFQQCVEVRPPVERMACYLERVDSIIEKPGLSRPRRFRSR